MENHKIKITPELAKAAVLGGVFLGGGGGGSLKTGLETAQKALELGDLYLVSPEVLNEDEIVITASAVGSPASKEQYISYEYCEKAYSILQNILDKKIGGVITNENGGHSITNGWILSALTQIPLIDAPCNGRAHPTATMGSMGLTQLEEYETVQVALGGNPDKGKYIELAVRGKLEATSRLVRQSAVEAGGLVTVLRNPVEGKYLIKNAAVGGLDQAIKIGKIFIENEDNVQNILSKLKDVIGLQVLATGIVKECSLKTEGGFDIGNLLVEEDNKLLEISFWNEYMTLESNDIRLATFPDLIATLDANTGNVLTSAEIKTNDEIIVVRVDKSNLKLGKGMFDKSLFKQVEDILDKELIKFVF